MPSPRKTLTSKDIRAALGAGMGRLTRPAHQSTSPRGQGADGNNVAGNVAAAGQAGHDLPEPLPKRTPTISEDIAGWATAAVEQLRALSLHPEDLTEEQRGQLSVLCSELAAATTISSLGVDNDSASEAAAFAAFVDGYEADQSRKWLLGEAEGPSSRH